MLESPRGLSILSNPEAGTKESRTKGRRRILRPSLFKSNGVVFDLSICNLGWNQIPEPDCKDSVIDGDDASAHGERGGRFAETGVFAPPMPRAENNHQHGKQGGDR